MVITTREKEMKKDIIESIKDLNENEPENDIESNDW